MQARSYLLAIITIGFIGYGCGGDAEREAKLAAMSPKERQIQAVLDQRCVKCHTPPNHEAKLDLTHPMNLLPLISSERLFDDLALYNMLMGDSTISEHERSEFKLTQPEIDMIRDWMLSDHQDMMPDSSAAADSAMVRM